ncbi:cell division protein ZapA [Novosphingobium sp.]|uniref:cell division protein ZapA n=1 Tax=Novosphingobium sp. TaxID=1874826 RepID=UPI0025DE2A95|nr:cell division protein ZapA [Novosphingobium sp.]MCC6925775.1 cell division protein ZapA [Novosphingobium sp.]
MSNVTLQIGGRNYMVSCSEGEEAHVQQLGQMIEGKVRDLGAAGHNEVRLLLFAALLLADELHDARAKAASAGGATDPALLETIAARLEKCATALEG